MSNNLLNRIANEINVVVKLKAKEMRYNITQPILNVY